MKYTFPVPFYIRHIYIIYNTCTSEREREGGRKGEAEWVRERGRE